MKIESSSFPLLICSDSCLPDKLSGLKVIALQLKGCGGWRLGVAVFVGVLDGVTLGVKVAVGTGVNEAVAVGGNSMLPPLPSAVRGLTLRKDSTMALRRAWIGI